MIDYIKESNKKAQNRNEYMLFSVPVYVINKFPSNIKINNILDSVKDIIDKKYLDGLEAIYIGDFKEERYSIYVKRWCHMDIFK